MIGDTPGSTWHAEKASKQRQSPAYVAAGWYLANKTPCVIIDEIQGLPASFRGTSKKPLIHSRDHLMWELSNAKNAFQCLITLSPGPGWVARMEEPQSFSRTVTPTQSGPAPTTICGSNMKLASSNESSSEGNGNISLCIMVHGMGGSEADWQTWIEILNQRFPDWVLWPLQKMASACSFMGKELRELSKIAASDSVLMFF